MRKSIIFMVIIPFFLFNSGIGYCDQNFSFWFLNKYTGHSSIPSKEFKLLFASKENVYVYIINKDVNGRFKLLFPRYGNFPLQKYRVYSIPFTGYFLMKYPADESIYAIVSDKKVMKYDLYQFHLGNTGWTIKRIFN